VLVAVAVVLEALLVVTVVVTVVTVELVLEAVSGAVVLATVGLDPPQPASPSTPSIDRTIKKTRTRVFSAAVG
jgi:hypothetical protein